MLFLTWLRRKVADAVLAGINDAAAAIDSDGDEPAAVAQLTARLRALPEPEEPANGKRRVATK